MLDVKLKKYLDRLVIGYLNQKKYRELRDITLRLN